MSIKSVIDWLVTPPENGPDADNPQSADAFVPAHMAQPAALSILICDFDGPKGHEVAQRLIGMLAQKSGIKAQLFNKKLKVSGRGNMVEKFLHAAEMGRKWMIATETDLLLWGEIDVEKENLSIHFLCAVADTDKQPGSIGLADTLEIPINYDSALEDIILASSIAAAGPRKKGLDRTDLTRMLEIEAVKLTAYMDVPPSNLEQRQFASVTTFIGSIFSSLWRMNGDDSYLDRAIKTYKGALSNTYDRENPMNWALAHNHLAAALQAQSKRDNSLPPLLEAADAYRAVVAALSLQTHANDWALAHIHLGDVLVRQSSFIETVQKLKEASEAYQVALLVFTRQTMPGPWSELLNQIGVTLMQLGEMVAGTRTLDQSATCFRQALEVRRREVAPLLWAQTANNLGAVTFSLYKRDKNATLLNEAEACFAGATEVYAQFGRKNTAKVAQGNLDRVRHAKSG